ncbi:MAG: trehalose-6-phosphate synthase [Dehalococcoidales bacterium]|nr:trehalose-6-phosphate synthase [Dehalococcoidales bacterium]
MRRLKGQSSLLRTGRLIVVSNRLPIALTRGTEGEWQVRSGSGGLVTALSPVLRDLGGLWIGWPGTVGKTHPDEDIFKVSRNAGYSLIPVGLTRKEIDLYYYGFSNKVLWPLFHTLQSNCNFDPAYWAGYQAVNRKFARIIADSAKEDDYVWVHDYHLMLVAKELRALGVKCRVGFFLHTPFPPPDLLTILPWRSQIIEALMEYDLIGFQTIRDRNNFIHYLEGFVKGVHVDTRRQVCTINTPQRQFRSGAFPISIDFKEFSRRAASKTISKRAERLRTAIGANQVVLGVDRLDYSKGIPERLKAFRNALERFDDLHGKVTLVQIVVPSREEVSEYQGLKIEIEGLVGEISGKFSQPGWTPVHYMFRNFKRDELLAYYRAADIALVTPLRDGMNLVAKEFCAANVDNSGVLILSEFAGAATQLRSSALVVNPYDIESTANAIYHAYEMGPGERRKRMRNLRESVSKRDIFWWVDFFLWAATATSLNKPGSPE